MHTENGLIELLCIDACQSGNGVSAYGKYDLHPEARCLVHPPGAHTTSIPRQSYIKLQQSCMRPEQLGKRAGGESEPQPGGTFDSVDQLRLRVDTRYSCPRYSHCSRPTISRAVYSSSGLISRSKSPGLAVHPRRRSVRIAVADARRAKRTFVQLSQPAKAAKLGFHWNPSPRRPTSILHAVQLDTMSLFF